MARVKTYAVDVEYVVKRTLFVQARRPKGAEERALSEDGWRDATMYDEDAPAFPPRDVTVTRVREA